MELINEIKSKDLDPLADAKARIHLVSRWNARLNKLTKRKKNPLTQTEFCLKYDFNDQWFSRAKNQKPLPFWRKIEQVEKAFENEGV